MTVRTSFFSLNKFDIHGLSTFVVLVLMSIVLLPVHAQSGGLKVIVNNERESGEVCVFSESKTLPCKYADIDDTVEFQFAPNAIPVGEEFHVCLNKDFCIIQSNGPENEPEHVTLQISDLEVQPSDANQPPQEVQPSDANQPSEEEIEDSGFVSILIFILLIAVAAVIGIVIKKLKKLSRDKKQEERHGFPDIIKERILKKQNHRCAHCKRLLNVVDWDHKNGKRYNNSESNCQALCPNCHAIKTRTSR